MLITGIQIDGQAANADLSAGTERQARAPPWAPLTRAAPLGQALREARHWEGITDRSWGRYEPKSSSLCLTFFDRKCLLAPKVLRGRGGDQSLGQPVRHYRDGCGGSPASFATWHPARQKQRGLSWAFNS